MERVKKIIAFRLVRFILVGVGNTALNFLILNFAFYELNQSKIVSSFIATACAVAFSFILNRNFVFVDKTRPARQLIMFIVVTVSGVLLVQNSVYALGISLLRGHEAHIASLLRSLTGIQFSHDFIDINLSNVVASLFVMAWNYNGYRIFVFKGERHGDDIIETETAA